MKKITIILPNVECVLLRIRKPKIKRRNNVFHHVIPQDCKCMMFKTEIVKRKCYRL